MRKFLLAATAGLAIVSAGSLTATRANAMPVGAPAGLIDEMNLVDNVRLCFYVDGWNGPGLYECGFRFRRGMGFHGRRGGGGRDVIGNRGRGGFQGNGNNRGGGNRGGRGGPKH